MAFHKRRFTSIGQAFTTALGVAFCPKAAAQMVTGRGDLSPNLREKIMLAVTSVNQCRYCSFVHTQLALREGASHEEVKELLSGSVDVVEEEEREALLYAQHWADTAGSPDSEARLRVVDAYGEEMTRSIEAAIRAITAGNYFGNTFDYLLHSVSGGRLASEPE